MKNPMMGTMKLDDIISSNKVFGDRYGLGFVEE